MNWWPLGQIHFIGLFGSCKVVNILKNLLYCLKFRIFLIKIPDSRLLLKMFKIYTINWISCYLTGVGLSWLRYVFSSFPNAFCCFDQLLPYRKLLHRYWSWVSLPFIHVLTMSFKYLLVLTHLPGMCRPLSLWSFLQKSGFFSGCGLWAVCVIWTQFCGS